MEDEHTEIKLSPASQDLQHVERYTIKRCVWKALQKANRRAEGLRLSAGEVKLLMGEFEMEVEYQADQSTFSAYGPFELVFYKKAPDTNAEGS